MVSSSFCRLRDLLTIKNFYSCKSLHTGVQCCVNVVNWRIERGLPANPYKYGPLVDLPDWSYADGRPAPLARAQKRRIIKHMEYCQKIVMLTKEVDDAVNLNRKLKEDAELKLSSFMKNRLKKKGDKRTQMQG